MTARRTYEGDPRVYVKCPNPWCVEGRLVPERYEDYYVRRWERCLTCGGFGDVPEPENAEEEEDV